MEKKIGEESMEIALLLTFIGGFLDSYTYILYDKVFANAQTGNLIFFSMYLTGGDIKNAVYRIIPIIFFCISIIFVQVLQKKYNKIRSFLIISVNIILLIIISNKKIIDMDILVISIVSFICANMIVVFRKVQGIAFAPTMCTGNLRSCMLHISEYLFERKVESKYTALKYIYIIIIFCVGVGVGAICTHIFKNSSTYICVFVFIIILIILKKYNSNSIKNI